jgi:hypothetical protein
VIENMSFDDLNLLLGVTEIRLRYGWFTISLFMDFDSPYCIVTSSRSM